MYGPTTVPELEEEFGVAEHGDNDAAALHAQVDEQRVGDAHWVVQCAHHRVLHVAVASPAVEGGAGDCDREQPDGGAVHEAVFFSEALGVVDWVAHLKHPTDCHHRQTVHRHDAGGEADKSQHLTEVCTKNVTSRVEAGDDRAVPQHDEDVCEHHVENKVVGCFPLLQGVEDDEQNISEHPEHEHTAHDGHIHDAGSVTVHVRINTAIHISSIAL